VFVAVHILLAGIAVDGGNGICNGTCEEVPIALCKRQGRVAALDEEIEGWLCASNLCSFYIIDRKLLVSIGF